MDFHPRLLRRFRLVLTLPYGDVNHFLRSSYWAQKAQWWSVAELEVNREAMLE